MPFSWYLTFDVGDVGQAARVPAVGLLLADPEDAVHAADLHVARGRHLRVLPPQLVAKPDGKEWNASGLLMRSFWLNWLEFAHGNFRDGKSREITQICPV